MRWDLNIVERINRSMYCNNDDKMFLILRYSQKLHHHRLYQQEHGLMMQSYLVWSCDIRLLNPTMYDIRLRDDSGFG